MRSLYDEVLEEIEDLEADNGSLLMVRRVCLTPRVSDDHPQRHNHFHSRCTFEGQVCKFITLGVQRMWLLKMLPSSILFWNLIFFLTNWLGWRNELTFWLLDVQ